MRLALLLVVAACEAGASDPCQGPWSAPPPRSCGFPVESFDVFVGDYITGAPIPSALVTLEDADVVGPFRYNEGPARCVANTDPQGRVHVELPTGMTWRVGRIEARGYATDCPSHDHERMLVREQHNSYTCWLRPSGGAQITGP